LRRRRVTLVCEVTHRHQHIRFWKISRDAPPGNAVRHNREAARQARLPLVVAEQIDTHARFKPTRADVLIIHKHHTTSVPNSAVTIVESVNRSIELIVTAYGHHQELIRLQLYFR